MKTIRLLFTCLLGCIAFAGCTTCPSKSGSPSGLTGAWRAKIHLTSGAYAAAKDMEFLYVFNVGGTMTESANYDSAPPVPPAYGAWRDTGPREYEYKSVYYTTKPPAKFDDIAGGGGWLPSGWGVVTEKIVIAADGQHFQSKVHYEEYDSAGKRTDVGDGTGDGERIGF
jgi:hypothetical protein